MSAGPARKDADCPMCGGPMYRYGTHSCLPKLNAPEGQKDADTVATKLNAHEWADWFESPQGAARLSMEGRRNIAALLRLLTDLPPSSPEGAPAGPVAHSKSQLRRFEAQGAPAGQDGEPEVDELIRAMIPFDPTPTDAPGLVPESERIKLSPEAGRLAFKYAMGQADAPGDEERALLDEIEVELDGLVSWSSDKHAPERAAKIRAAIRRALRSAPRGDV